MKRLLLLALALSAISPARGEAPAPGGGAPAGPAESASLQIRSVTPEQARAVERGLIFLARRQEPDGSWGGNPAPIAVTSLCTLAFLAGGNTESRGRHSVQVRKALDYLLAHVETDPRAGFQLGYIHHPDDESSRLHGHAFATLALAEALGGIDRTLLPGRAKEYKAKLTLAVRLIERSQERLWGGWYYEPRPGVEHEGSVTVCQIQALRAARNAGIRVDPDVIRRALSYVKKSQDKEGGFLYAVNVPNSATYELTAAATSTLNGLGDYGSPAYRRGLEYLMRHLDRHLVMPRYFFYGNFYAAQAMWQADSRTGYWARYWPRVRRRLLEAESRDSRTGQPTGRWEPSDVQHGSFPVWPEYGTAMACLILQIPYGFLPIFQR